jgi:hypothetical protein
VTKEVLALGITVLVHVVGLMALVWMLVLEPEDRPNWRDWWPGGDDDAPRAPSDGPRGGEVPMRDAVPSAVRLREPVPLGTGRGRRTRRPAHRPERAPQRTPAGR